MKLRSAALDDAYALARLHGAAFERAWSEGELAEMLVQPGSFALAAEAPSESGGEIQGFILCRAIAGEGEVLTIGVDPAARRQGIARALMTAAGVQARALGAMSLFLEVAVDNDGAIALYEGLGYERAGLRRAYYSRGAAPPADAVVMRLSLNSPPP